MTKLLDQPVEVCQNGNQELTTIKVNVEDRQIANNLIHESQGKNSFAGYIYY